MPGTSRILVAALALSLGPLASVALAQAVVPPTTEPGAGPARPPSAGEPNLQTPNPKAADLGAYRGMLQTVEQQVRDSLAKVEGGARPTQTGAMSPDAIQLMQSVINAREAVGRAPASFENNPTFGEVSRHMRERFANLNRGRMEQSEVTEAGRDMLQSLQRLRAAVDSAGPA
ncbi:hypothetical protein [Roseomonas sp. BN140053]|uniref:hypothetical protein n=1 Tax=Roseomonas sp. BN140053 TaxID=3391898 RepID=UPI0039EBEF67